MEAKIEIVDNIRKYTKPQSQEKELIFTTSSSHLEYFP